MTGQNGITRTTATDHTAEPHGAERDYQADVPHGDEEAGGAVIGAAAGAVVGAVVGGPIGAVVGGAVGAASGATVGALDSKVKDDTTVVTRGVRPS